MGLMKELPPASIDAETLSWYSRILAQGETVICIMALELITDVSVT